MGYDVVQLMSLETVSDLGQLSQLAESLCTDPGLKTEIGVCERLDSTFKEKKKKGGQAAFDPPRTISQNPRMRGKSHYHS